MSVYDQTHTTTTTQPSKHHVPLSICTTGSLPRLVSTMPLCRTSLLHTVTDGQMLQSSRHHNRRPSPTGAARADKPTHQSCWYRQPCRHRRHQQATWSQILPYLLFSKRAKLLCIWVVAGERDKRKLWTETQYAPCAKWQLKDPKTEGVWESILLC